LLMLTKGRGNEEGGEQRKRKKDRKRGKGKGGEAGLLYSKYPLWTALWLLKEKKERKRHKGEEGGRGKKRRKKIFITCREDLLTPLMAYIMREGARGKGGRQKRRRGEGEKRKERLSLMSFTAPGS